MKESDIFRINRAAESGQIDPEQYAKLHEQIANDKLNNKLTKSEVDDINNWLNEQTKDLPDEIEFISADGVQKALYVSELKQISVQHDIQTAHNLEQLIDKQAARAESIARHVEDQRMALSKAIVQREAAKKEYFQKRDELKRMQAKYVAIKNKNELLRVVVEEKREELNALTVEGKNATNSIKEHFAKHDNFDFQADSHMSAPEYALRKARSFAISQHQLANVAAEQQDPDVRIRIELEQFRRESAFRRDQNVNIELLTGNSRAKEIETHEQNENFAAIQAAYLELKLEAKGIKVDFSNNEVEVRAIDKEERLSVEIHNNLNAIKLKNELETSLDKDSKAQLASDRELNDTGNSMDQKVIEVTEARSLYEDKHDEVSEHKLSLTDRLKKKRELAIANNNTIVMSPQQSAMLSEARTSQLSVAKKASLQQQPDLGHAKSR